MTGFFDTDRWNEIWQTISRNRKRSIMTALGVFWGIFMLTVMLGAGSGLGRLFRAQLGGMSTNTVLLQSSPTSVPYKGMPKGRWWNMDNDDVKAVSKLREVLYTSGIIWGSEMACTHGERKGDYQLMGYMPDYQQINPQKILYGRYLNDIDIAQKRKVCVIGTQIQKDLFPGQPDPTGEVIQVGGSYFTVVGVLRRGVLPGKVQAEGQRRDSVLPGDLPGGRAVLLLTVAHQHHAVAPCGQLRGTGPADARRGARYEGIFSFFCSALHDCAVFFCLTLHVRTLRRQNSPDRGQRIEKLSIFAPP